MTGKGKRAKKKGKKSQSPRLENLQNIDLQSVVENLESDRIELQGPAVEEAVDIANVLVVKAVDALRRGPHRFPIAERISRFGSIALPHVEQLFRESQDSEVQLLCALILLGLGSKVGVPYLLDAVLTREDYGFFAPLYLARANVKQVIEPILICLRRFDFQNIDPNDYRSIDAIGLLLGLLEEVETDLPPDLYEQLSHADVPWRIRMRLQQMREKKGVGKKYKQYFAEEGLLVYQPEDNSYKRYFLES